jgi:hypothetical protein
VFFFALWNDNSLGPNTIQTLRKLGLGEEYDSVAETDERGGLFFEWWDGREDKKHGEVGGRLPRCQSLVLAFSQGSKLIEKNPLSEYPDLHQLPQISMPPSSTPRRAPLRHASQRQRPLWMPRDVCGKRRQQGQVDVHVSKQGNRRRRRRDDQR